MCSEKKPFRGEEDTLNRYTTQQNKNSSGVNFDWEAEIRKLGFEIGKYFKHNSFMTKDHFLDHCFRVALCLSVGCLINGLDEAYSLFLDEIKAGA